MRAPKTEGAGEFEKHPAGAARLVCSRIIDKGTVFNEYKGKDQHKVNLYFESEKLMSTGDFAGQPFLVIANFNYSMYQNSHLCQFIEQWRGKKFANQDEADNFDLSKLISQTGYASIVHSDDGKWVNINTIMPLPEGMEPLAIKGDSYVFDLESPDMAVFGKLSEKVQNSIKLSHEYKTMMVGVSGTSGAPVAEPVADIPPSKPLESYDDDIPF